jgi:hypothetical protein
MTVKHPRGQLPAAPMRVNQTSTDRDNTAWKGDGYGAVVEKE